MKICIKIMRISMVKKLDFPVDLQEQNKFYFVRFLFVVKEYVSLTDLDWLENSYVNNV